MNDNNHKLDSPNRRRTCRRPRWNPRPASLDFHQLESRNLLAAISNTIVDDWIDGAAGEAYWEIDAQPQIIPGGYGVDQLPVMGFPPAGMNETDSSFPPWPESFEDIEFLVTSSDPGVLPIENVTLERNEFAINISLMPAPGKFGDVQIGISALSNGQVLSTSQILVSVIDAVHQDGRVVTISGSNADDQIAVSMDGEFKVDWNGYNFEVPIEQVAVVVILGNGGDDQILVSGLPAGIGLNVLGGSGNDLIQIASDVKSPAFILGGSGTDTLISQTGRDLTVADGADRLPRFDGTSQSPLDDSSGIEGLPFASSTGLELSLPTLGRQPMTKEMTVNTTSVNATSVNATSDNATSVNATSDNATSVNAMATELVKPSTVTGHLTEVVYQIGLDSSPTWDATGLAGLGYSSGQLPTPEFARICRRDSIFARIENTTSATLGAVRIDEEKSLFQSITNRHISAEQFLVLSLGCAEINKVFLVSRPANQITRRDD